MHPNTCKIYRAYCVECRSQWASDNHEDLEAKAAQHETTFDGHFVKVEYPIVRTEE